jgi:hypothetical protein
MSHRSHRSRRAWYVYIERGAKELVSDAVAAAGKGPITLDAEDEQGSHFNLHRLAQRGPFTDAVVAVTCGDVDADEEAARRAMLARALLARLEGREPPSLTLVVARNRAEPIPTSILALVETLIDEYRRAVVRVCSVAPRSSQAAEAHRLLDEVPFRFGLVGESAPSDVESRAKRKSGGRRQASALPLGDGLGDG